MADNKQQGGAAGAPETARARGVTGEQGAAAPRGMDPGAPRPGGMGDGPGQGGAGARRAGEGTDEAARRTGEAADEGARRVGEGFGEGSRRMGEGFGEGARRMGEGFGEGSRRMGEGFGEGARRVGEGFGEGSRRMGEGFGEGSRRMGEGFGEGSRRMGEGGRSAAESLGEATRRTAESLGSTARRAGEAFGSGTQRGLEAVAHGQRQALDEAAEEIAVTGQRLAEVVREAVEGMRVMVMSPGLSGESVRDAQHAMTRLMDGMMATGMRLTQEMLRRTGPGALVEMQHRVLRDYVDALTESGTVLLRVTRHAAEEQLRPMERQLRQRQEQQAPGRGGNGQHGGGRQQGQGGPRIAEVMSREVRIASPEDSVQQAARMMAEEDAGVLPVGENDRLVGMVTDRDLTLRVTAEGRDAARTKVRDVMTGAVHWVFEDEPAEQAASTMAERQIRRLPVLNRQKRLVGIISLGDLADADQRTAGRAMRGIVGEGWARHHGGAGARHGQEGGAAA